MVGMRVQFSTILKNINNLKKKLARPFVNYFMPNLDVGTIFLKNITWDARFSILFMCAIFLKTTTKTKILLQNENVLEKMIRTRANK
jgi:hypothetical protein